MLIGELAQHSGVSARMLRHYDSLGLVSPTGRTSGGYREYSEEDIRRLFQVECLRSLGMSLRDLQTALDESAVAPSDLVGQLIAHTQERIAQEKELLIRLRRVQDSAPANWADVLRIVSILRGLDSDSPSRRQQSAMSIDEETRLSEKSVAEAVLAEANPNVAGALRWALQRSSSEAVDVLGRGLDSPDPDTRLRAVTAIATLDTEESRKLLTDALQHSDSTVRGRAAIALGVRGQLTAVPELLALIVSGFRDVEAAETLGALARKHELVEQIAAEVVELVGNDETQPDARLRLTQALAEFPGSASGRALEVLSEDSEISVRLTAAYLKSMRER